MVDVVEAAADYIGMKWRPIRVKYKDKAAFDTNWQSEQQRDPKEFAGYNIGVQLGEASNWLVDVDIDCPEALIYADQLLPGPTLTFGRATALRTHRLYYAKNAVHLGFTHGKKKDGGGTIVELRSNAHYTVFPPSIHKDTGEHIDWADLVEPLEVDAETLKDAVTRVAVFTLLRKHAGIGAPIDFDLEYFEIEIEPKIPDDVAKKCREWMGIGSKKKKRTRTALENTSEFKKAVAKYNSDHAEERDWPTSGGSCPMCQHNGCFGRHPTESYRWMCFSTAHGDSGIGKRVENGDAFSGDVVDLDAFLFGVSIPQLLVNRGYLKGSDGLPLTRSESGRTMPTLGNVVVILKGDPTFAGMLRYNTFAHREVWTKVPDPLKLTGTPIGSAVRDTDAKVVAAWIEQNYRSSIHHATVNDAFSVVAAHDTFHPLKERIESVRWDGAKRIDTWMSRYLGTEDTLMARELGSRWLISAIARLYEPGCKADCALTLVGGQGKYKSSIFKTLALDDAYFTDDIGHVSESKAAAERLHGKWIIEAAEMSSLTRAAVETVKAFLSRTTDNYRPAYGRRNEDYGRQCIFAVTTNDMNGFLRDATGGRRFWPAEVNKDSIDIKALRAVMGQLWAETLVRYKDGSKWWIDKDEVELYGDVTRAQADYTVDSPYAEQVAKYVANKSVVIIDRFLKSTELDPRQWPAVRAEVAATLLELGFISKGRARINGLQIRLWARSEVEAEGQALVDLLQKEHGMFAGAAVIPIHGHNKRK